MSKLFDQIGEVWQGSKNLTTKTKPDSVFMTCRFVSLDPAGLVAANFVNRAHPLPDWAALPILKYLTPDRQPPRNKYPKKLVEVDKIPAKKQKNFDMLCKKFNVDEIHGRQIMSLLEEQGFKFEGS